MFEKDYSVSRSQIPFFGRAYALTIFPKQGPSAGQSIVVSSDTFEPNALRFTFDIFQVAWSAMWEAEIIIYNADGDIQDGPSKGINLYNAVIQEGDTVSIAAGYQADYPFPNIPPVIWQGEIFYTILDRVDVVDRRLVIRSLMFRSKKMQNWINKSIPWRANQLAQARWIAQHSRTPVNFDEDHFQRCVQAAQPQRGAAELPRGKTYFGLPDTYLGYLADQNGLLNWYSNKGWETDNIQFPVGTLKATYGPVIPRGGPPAKVGNVTLSLIGQPQQTQLGVDFRVLLDPTIQITAPLPKVSVQPQFIRQAPVSYPLPKGQGPPRPIENEYVVVGVKFVGDTRGNPWYTEITGVVNVNQAVQMLGWTKQASFSQD
jgi:hypothetical protein